MTITTIQDIFNVEDFRVDNLSHKSLMKIKQNCEKIQQKLREEFKSRIIPILATNGNWMTVADVAEIFGVSKNYMNRVLRDYLYSTGEYICLGDLPCFNHNGVNKQWARQLPNGRYLVCGNKKARQPYLRTKCDENGHPIGESKKCYYSYHTTVYKVI